MKTKKITKEEYIKEFCLDLRLRKRNAIYVRKDIHLLIERIVRSLKQNGYDITLSAFVTVILIRHINKYDYLHNTFREETAKRPATPQGVKTGSKNPSIKPKL